MLIATWPAPTFGIRATSDGDRDPLDERADAAEPRPEDHPRLLGELAFEPLRQAGVDLRLARRDQAEGDIAVRPPELLAVEHVARVEARHLAGDARRHARWIERLDRADAAPSRDQPVPRGGHIHAERRDGTHPGDHDAARRACRSHRTSFPVRTVAAR